MSAHRRSGQWAGGISSSGGAAFVTTPSRGKRAISILSVLAMVFAMLSFNALSPSVPEASAATVNIGNLKAQMNGLTGGAGSLRYATRTSGSVGERGSGQTTSPSSSPSGWVNSSGESFGGHGNNNNSDMLTSKSSVGVSPRPVTSVDTGVPFALAGTTHYNNPISGTGSSTLKGNIQVQITDAGGNKTLTFPWTLWETSNSANPCANGGSNNSGINVNGCADRITFDTQISDQTLTYGNTTYKLVILGFMSATSPTSCPTFNSNNLKSEFWTKESDKTSACIYASLAQVHKLTVTKTANAAGTFSFTSKSTFSGSEWDLSSGFTLAPTQGSLSKSRVKDLLDGEKVTIAEGTLSDEWALSGIQCVEKHGTTTTTLQNPVVTITGQQLVLDTSKISGTYGDITCTYTNKYTPKGTLTLVKVLSGQPSGNPAKTSDWTLTATGSDKTISGKTGEAVVTSVRVPAGTYTFTEVATGGINTAGFGLDSIKCVVQDTSGTSTLNAQNPTFNVQQGKTVTCTYTNKYSSGKLKITKKVDPAAGYTGGTSKNFTGTYSCTYNGTALPSYSGSFSVRTNSSFTKEGIPTGAECTVSEHQPDGSLANGSYEWDTPTYNPAGGKVTIVNGTEKTVEITNRVKQNTGSLVINKVVSPRSGTPAEGYTGTANRAFAIGYNCTVGTGINASTKSGTVNLASGASTTISGVPAGASCTVTEANPSANSGDFADSSYAWDGNSIDGSGVTVGKGQEKSVTVTNYFKRNFVTLTVKKVVDGDGYTASGKNFTIDITGCVTQTITLANGETSSNIQVPAGVACTVTERTGSSNLDNAWLDAAHEWGTPTYTHKVGSGNTTAGATITIPNGKTGLVTVTNHTTPIYGTVKVTKKVTGATSGLQATTTFPITVTCGTYTKQMTLANDGSDTTASLPVGTECTISETAPTGSDGLVDDSYVWGAAPADQTATIAKNQQSEVTVTNTISRAYGTLSIQKAVESLNGVNGATTSFNGQWECTYGGNIVASGTWSSTGSGPASLTGNYTQIPLTSTCSVTSESDPAAPSNDTSYVWGAVDLGSSATMTANGASITVTNTVERITGSFGISKSVTGADAGVGYTDGAQFSFTYTCTPLSGDPISDTVSVTAGSTVNVDGIPAGSTCVVTESDTMPDPIDPYRWTGLTLTVTGASGSQSGRSISFVLPAPEEVADEGNGEECDPELLGEGEECPVTPEPEPVIPEPAVIVHATNTLTAQSGSVTVTKKVTGETSGVAENATFPISLVCGNTTYDAQDVAVDGTATFGNIPLGQTCSASEGDRSTQLRDNSYAWDGDVTYDPQAITVATTGDNGTITVTNKIKRVYNTDIQLEKIITNNDYFSVAAQKAFSGAWQCQYGTDAAVTGTWSRTGAGSATLTGVPTGGLLADSICKATSETLPQLSDPSYSWATPTFNQVTVPTSGPATMTVTNTLNRSFGELKVTKAVTGEGAAGYTGTDKDFDIYYQCYLSTPNDDTAVSATVKVAKGETSLSNTIPAGWTCTVQETSKPSLSSPYYWGDPQYSAASVVIVTGQPQNITVSNPVGITKGTFTIEKNVDGVPEGVLVGDGYQGGYACTLSTGGAQTGTWFVGPTGGVVTFDGSSATTLTLPVGSSCSATEGELTQNMLKDGSWAWNAAQINGPVTVAEGSEAVATVTVTNSVHRVYRDLTVRKLYGEQGENGENDPDALLPETEVSGLWQCFEPGNDSDEPTVSGRWTLRVVATAGGTSVQVADAADAETPRIPAGSTCSIIEDTLSDNGDGEGGGSVLRDASYTWGEPSYGDPEGVRTEASVVTGDILTVTNSTHRVYGTLTVAKLVQGAADSDIEYSGSYTCTYGEGVPRIGEWSTKAGESVTISGILVGSFCTLTEDNPIGPVASDSSYYWAGYTVGSNPDPAVVVRPDGETSSGLVMTVTNRSERRIPPPPPVTPGSAALVIQKLASVATLTPGDTFDYTLTVTNSSDETAHNVKVTDAIPATIAVTSWSASGWSCAITGQTAGFGGNLNCDYSGTLAGKAAAPMITLHSRLSDSATAGSDITNTGVVTWKNPDDSDGGPVSDSVVVSVLEVQAESSTAEPTPEVDGESGTTDVEVKDETKTENIAYTGVDTFGMGLLALMLLAGGGLLIGIADRRRQPRKH